MGRTHHEQNHEQKREEIVAAARTLFVEHGYEGASIRRLAQQMQVAPNTLYWYFADKDALLVAVMKQIVSEALSEYQGRRDAPLDAQLRWLFGMFCETQRLVAIVHGRVHCSPEVRAWHDTFHRIMESQIQRELRERGVAPGQEGALARCISFITEGIVAHQSSKAEQRRIIKLLVSMAERGTQA